MTCDLIRESSTIHSQMLLDVGVVHTSRDAIASCCALWTSTLGRYFDRETTESCSSRMNGGINKGTRHQKLKGPLVGHVLITRFRAGDSRHRGWVKRTEICADGTRVGGSFIDQNKLTRTRPKKFGCKLAVLANNLKVSVVSELKARHPKRRIWRLSRNLAEAVAERLRIAAGDVEERHIKLRSGADWGDASERRGGVATAGLERRCSRDPGTRWRSRRRAPGNANAAAAHAVSGAGRTIVVHGGRESVWERDSVKDATLQSENRVGAGSNLEEGGRTVMDNEGRSGRGRGTSREKRRERERNAPKSRDSHEPRSIAEGRELGTSHRCQYVVARTLDSSGTSATANRPHPNMEKNFNVEGQRERDRGEDLAGA
ncbi:hypothetical protein B0H13DRAFT_1927315 [Mycena leptocephala]|nr:hypothetical protein B0H13DRAFT_1927315 [Mycena leptocephala]